MVVELALEVYMNSSRNTTSTSNFLATNYYRGSLVNAVNACM